MPLIVPTTPVAPFDKVERYLQSARTKLNDAIASLGGDVLTDIQPFTQSITNDAYRKMQEFLDNLGYSANVKECLIASVPAVTNQDPASNTWISWTQFFDGNNFWTEFVLPQDMILPKRLWERPAGTNSCWWPMEIWLDGFPGWAKQFRNQIWEWRDNTIWLPGALNAMDLRIRYGAYKPDFQTIGDTPWTEQQVPFMRSLEALSNFIAAEVAGPRGDLDASQFTAKGELACKYIMNRDVSQKQRKNIRRRAHSDIYNRSSYLC